MGETSGYEIIIGHGEIKDSGFTTLPESEDIEIPFWNKTKSEEVTLTMNAPEECIYNLTWMSMSNIIKGVLTPKSIIHNRKNDSYIVIWKWGEKTTVKPMPGELSSPYAAFTAALAKLIYGSNSQVNKVVGMTIEPGKRGEKNITLAEKMKVAKEESRRERFSKMVKEMVERREKERTDPQNIINHYLGEGE